MGTADYLAPEQISGRPATAASDVYSLGVVLYEMLTGVTPFAGENTASVLYRQVHDSPSPLRSINPRLPAELQPIMDRVLAKNPSLRYSDPLNLARDLEETVEWLPPGSPWLGRRGVIAGATVLGGSQNGVHPPTGPLAPQPQQRNSGGAAVATTTGSNGKPRTTGPLGPSDIIEHDVPRTEELRRAVIAPPGDRKRIATLGIAAILLVAGILVLLAATGVLSGKKGGDNGARFQVPGPLQYAGPLRSNNGPNVGIPQAITPPTIDGNLSEWSGALPGPFDAPYVTYQKGRTWTGPDDISAQFYFAWDSENFYVAAVVTDNIHIQTTKTRGYDLYYGDDIEIWFDTDLPGDFASREGNADDFQLGLSPGDFAGLSPEAVFWKPDRSDSRNKMVKVGALPRVGASGYNIEAAMPWAAFGTYRPRAGGAIGFAASAGDSDNPIKPFQELMVSTAPTLQWNAPLTFGNLFF